MFFSNSAESRFNMSTIDDEGQRCYIPTSNENSMEDYLSGSWEQKILNGIRKQFQIIIDDMPGDIHFIQEKIGDDCTDDGLLVQCVAKINCYLSMPRFVKHRPGSVAKMQNLRNKILLNYDFDTRLARFLDSLRIKPPIPYISFPYMQSFYYNNQKLNAQYYYERGLKSLLTQFQRKMKELHDQQRWSNMSHMFEVAECQIFGVSHETIYQLNENEIATAVHHVNDKNAFVLHNGKNGACQHLLINKILSKYGKYNDLNTCRNGGNFLFRYRNSVMFWKCNYYVTKKCRIKEVTPIIQEKSDHLGKFCNCCLNRKFSQYNGKYIHCILFRCSGCRSVTYCSRKCQKKDWSRHKKDCLPHITPSFVQKYPKPY